MALVILRAVDGSVFYDVGSGAGKALVTAALSGINFLKCVGIELLPGLCEASKGVIDSLRQCLNSDSPGSPYSREALNIRNTSLLEVAFSLFPSYHHPLEIMLFFFFSF